MGDERGECQSGKGPSGVLVYNEEEKQKESQFKGIKFRSSLTSPLLPGTCPPCHLRQTESLWEGILDPDVTKVKKTMTELLHKQDS